MHVLEDGDDKGGDGVAWEGEEAGDGEDEGVKDGAAAVGELE